MHQAERLWAFVGFISLCKMHCLIQFWKAVENNIFFSKIKFHSCSGLVISSNYFHINWCILPLMCCSNVYFWSVSHQLEHPYGLLWKDTLNLFSKIIWATRYSLSQFSESFMNQKLAFLKLLGAWLSTICHWLKN